MESITTGADVVLIDCSVSNQVSLTNWRYSGLPEQLLSDQSTPYLTINVINQFPNQVLMGVVGYYYENWPRIWLLTKVINCLCVVDFYYDNWWFPIATNILILSIFLNVFFKHSNKSHKTSYKPFQKPTKTSNSPSIIIIFPSFHSCYHHPVFFFFLLYISISLTLTIFLLTSSISHFISHFFPNTYYLQFISLYLLFYFSPNTHFL